MENVSSDMEFSADSIADLCTRILVVVKAELLAGGGNARKVSPRQFCKLRIHRNFGYARVDSGHLGYSDHVKGCWR